MKRYAVFPFILLPLMVVAAALSLLPSAHAGTQNEMQRSAALDHVDPGLAYVALSESDMVAALYPITHTVPFTIDVGAAACDFPWRTALAPGGHSLLVSCRWSNNVVFVDTASRSVVAAVSNIDSPNGVAFTWDGSQALVGSRWSNRLAVVDTGTMSAVFVNTAAVPRSVVAHPFLDLAYAGLDNGELLVLDTATLATVTTIPFGGDVWDVAISPDGQWLYASDRWNGKLAIVDTQTNSIETTINELGNLNGIDVAPDGSTVYAGQLFYGVHVIDAATHDVTDFVTIPNTPWEIAVTCDGERLVVGNVTGEAVIVDTTTLAVVSVVLPGQASRGVAACAPPLPEGVRLYPAQSQAQAAPGETLTFELSLRHLEQVTHTYTLTVASSDWPASLPVTTVGPLTYGQDGTFAVEVTIPANAAWFESGETVVAATSTADPAITDSARLVSTAYAPPDVSISPASLTASQTAGEVTRHTVTIANGHGVTSTFDVSALPVSYTPYPGLSLSGGPDTFGYTYRDSNEANGPTYDWEDISESGTSIGVAGGDDTYYGPVPLNFTIDFYGNSYDEVYVSSNGYLSFGEGTGAIPYGAIPSPEWPNNVIALFGGDRYFDSDSAVYYETREYPTRTVLMFENVYDCCGGGGWSRTFEVILYPNGNILAQYESLDGTSSSYVGIENAGGSVGLSYSGFLTDGLAICYAYPGNVANCRPGDAPWLTANPTSGSVAPNSAQTVEIVLDARGVQPGAYVADLVVASDDLDSPHVVPVTLDVVPSVTMGRVGGTVTDAWSGLPLTATVRLGDVYTATAAPDFSIWAEAGSYTLQASAGGYIPEALAVDVLPGESTIMNAALEPAQPRLALAVDEIAATGDVDTIVSQDLVVSNTGPLPLELNFYELSAETTEIDQAISELADATVLIATLHGGWSGDYTTLIYDLEYAGATVLQQYSPIDAATLQGVDVLWVNCCGGVAWDPAELSAVSSWIQQGGRVLVHGPIDSSVTPIAALFGITYEPASCSGGATTDIGDHPINEGVDAVHLDWSCEELAFPADTTTLVADAVQGAPKVVARTHGLGRMVASSSFIFNDWIINERRNRLFANNAFAWLAAPVDAEVSWLSVTPQSLTIAPHSSQVVVVAFDGAGLDPGIFEATLGLLHNDPDRPALLEIPVTFTAVETVIRQHLPLIFRPDT